MNYLCIDLGSYSVKFYHAQQDKKKIVLNSFDEIIIEKVRPQVNPDATLYEIQQEIVSSYLKKDQFDGLVIYQLPSEMITTRYFELPVNNKKKAEMMIPFQLDENLPFPSVQSHYVSLLYSKGNSMFAQVNIAQTEYFEKLYTFLKDKGVLPGLMTSEQFVIQSFVEHHKQNGSFAVIDIGHSTTKGYFVHNRHVISNHIAYVAGRNFDSVISETYQISPEEAILYKHENCFFLTDEQIEEVDDDQKEFATLMKKTIWSLVNDIKRWELGYRVNYGKTVDKIYITGGSSNITNFDLFLTDHLGIPVEIWNPYIDYHESSFGVDEEYLNSFTICHMMASSQSAKQSPPNFLHGRFLGSFSQNIPMESTAFLMNRAFFLSLLLLLFVVGERVFLNRDIKVLNRKLTKMVKSSTLELNRKEKRYLRKQPEKLLKVLKKKNNQVAQEVKSIMSASTVNALDPLVSLSKLITPNKNVNLSSLNVDGTKVRAIFHSDDTKEMQKFAKYLKTIGLTNQSVVYKKGGIKATLNFEQ
ncbi:MAG: pilus assembly protein PilM [Bacteriovoracaceae bacterium]|nr:pilus assembly protein PilM [Bacteriovoracaceae bacterium]